MLTVIKKYWIVESLFSDTHYVVFLHENTDVVTEWLAFWLRICGGREFEYRHRDWLNWQMFLAVFLSLSK